MTALAPGIGLWSRLSDVKASHSLLSDIVNLISLVGIWRRNSAAEADRRAASHRRRVAVFRNDGLAAARAKAVTSGLRPSGVIEQLLKLRRRGWFSVDAYNVFE